VSQRCGCTFSAGPDGNWEQCLLHANARHLLIALEDIAVYWNGLYNIRALSDACEHMRATARAAMRKATTP